MRITGGHYKGRKLICPSGVIRPAMDRMRESLFAILGDIRGSSFLDLYSGSGSVGIEAASRGAEPVVFVEKDRGKRAVLERNLSFVREYTELYMLPVEHFLRRGKRSFDLIFADPPFRQRGKPEVLNLIADREILAGGGTLIIHLSKEEEKGFPTSLGTELARAHKSDGSAESGGSQLHLADRRLYGGSLLLFYGH
ncbi:MAG: 16S rRNA (guanine(966)-N(2))-methyltransferase RsmD [Spirochaetaceae bacterium]|nr:MAG: 16S rRNA (guanine(966)-N(2))-methyltransferase RsmD [Spirochaetaceae bacterium]